MACVAGIACIGSFGRPAHDGLHAGVHPVEGDDGPVRLAADAADTGRTPASGPADVVAQGLVRYEVFAVVVAVYMRGLRSVTLHAMGREADHAHVLDDSAARVLIAEACHRDRAAALRQRCTRVEHWLTLGEVPGFDELGAALEGISPAKLVAAGDAETVVRLAYTGGTTGRSKGVMPSNVAGSACAVRW